MAAELMAKEREMDALASQLASMEQMGGLSLGPHLRQMLAGRGAAVAPPEVKQCLEVAEQHKADGNALFEAGDDANAAKEYVRGISLLRQFDETKDSRITALHVALHLNCAAAHFRLENWEDVIAYSTPVVDLQPEGQPGIVRGLTIGGLIKALYRRGVAKSRLMRWPDAERDLAGCIRSANPQYADPARRELRKMRARWDAERARANQLSGFGGSLAHVEGGVYTDIEDERREKWIEHHRKQSDVERAFHENNKHRVANGKEEIDFEEWHKDRLAKKERQRERERKLRDAAAAAAEAKRRDARLAAGVERVVVEDEPELAGVDARGYEKLAAGGETPYFAREAQAAAALLDDATRAELEAAAAPAKLEDVDEAAAPPRVSVLPSDQSKWCTKALRKSLTKARASSASDEEGQAFSVSLKCTKVSTVVGEASITVMAGTRRYIFDYSAFLDWEAEVKGDGDSFALFFGGSARLPEVASTVIDGAYDVELTQKRPCAKPRHAAALDKGLALLRANILARVGAFVDEYRGHRRVPPGKYVFEHPGGAFDVELRGDGKTFWCPTFPAKATYGLDGDDLTIVFGPYGTFRFRETLLGVWEGARAGRPEDWRRCVFARSLTPAEQLVSGSAWELSFKRGRPFRVELRADFSFVSPDYPGKFAWKIADGVVVVDWGRYGTFDLEIDVTNGVLKGDKRGAPGDWRRLDFVERLPCFVDPQE